MIFGFNTDVKYESTVYHVQSEARKHEHLLQTQVFVKGRCIGKHAVSFAEKLSDPEFTEDHLHDLLKDQHKHYVELARKGTIESELHMEPHHAAAVAAPSSAATLPPPVATPKPAEADRLPSIDELLAEAAATVTPSSAPPEPPPLELSAVDAIVLDEPAPPPAPEPDPEPAPNAPPRIARDVLDEVATAPAPMDDLAAQFAAAVAGKAPDVEAAGLVLSPTGGVIGKGISLECLPPSTVPDGSAIMISVQVGDESGAAAGAQVSCRLTSGPGPASYVYSTSGSTGIADLSISLKGLDLSATGLLIQATFRGKSASRKYQLRRA
ncbi:MAG: hypothetical protein ACR2IF_06695 [Terriglobales bacterium]